MALERKTATIPFRFGVDEGTEKEADPQGLLTLSNGVFDKEGSIRRRYGFVEVDDAGEDARGLLVAGKVLASVHADSVKKFVPGVGFTEFITATQSVVEPFATVDGGLNVQSVDVAILTVASRTYLGVASMEYREDDNGQEIWERYFDYDTGALLHESRWSGLSNETVVRIAADPSTSRFVIVAGVDALATGTVKMRTFLPALLSHGSTFDLYTGGAKRLASPALDFVWDTDEGHGYVAYINASDKVEIKRFAASGSVTHTGTSTNDAHTSTAEDYSHPVVLRIVPNASPVRVLVAVFRDLDDGNDVAVETWNASNLTHIGDDIITGIASQPRMKLAVAADASGEFSVLYDSLGAVSASGVSGIVRTSVALDGTGVPSVAGDTDIAHIHLISRPENVTSTTYRAVLYSGDPQFPGLFFARVRNPRVEAQVTFDDASLSFAEGVTLGNVVTVDATESIFAVPSTVELLGAQDEAEEDFGGGHRRRIKIVRLRNDDALPPVTSTIEDTAFLAGSVPRFFDGSLVSELGPMSAPVKPTLAAAVGSDLEAGTYSYLTVLEYVDSRGTVYLSAPSEVSQVVTGGGNERVDITAASDVPSSAITNATPSRRRLHIYRTLVDEADFHLLTSLPVGPSSDFVTYTDLTPDVELESAPSLYAAIPGIEGPLANEPVPPLRHIWTHRNRLFGIRADLPTQIRYTTEMSTDQAPRWNGVLQINVNNRGGEIIAGASLGANCILFQRDQILAFAGEGPDGNGNGTANYSTPEVVSHGIGAIDAASVVTIPGGVFFRASTGFYIIESNLAVQFVGKAVLDSERAMGDTCAASFLPKRHQVWVSGDTDGTILVFDTRFGRWSTFTPLAGTGSVPADAWVGFVELDGVVYAQNANGKLYTYSEDVWADEGALPIRLAVDLPWFRAAGHNGEFRVWRVLLTVKRVGVAGAALDVTTYTYQPRAQLSKDAEVADGTHTFTTANLAAGLSELRVRPNRQRASAFRCRVRVSDDDSAVEGLRLVSLKYAYGVISEAGKTPGTPTIT